MKIREGIIWEIAIIAITLPGSICLNKYLGADQRGVLATIMIMPTFVGTLIGCQWDKIIRATILENSNSLAGIWWKTKHYLIGMSVVGIFISIMLIFTQNNLNSIEKNQAILASLFLIPLSLAGLFIIAILNAMHKQREYYYVRVVGPIIFLLTVLAWSFFELTITKVIISYILLWTSIVILGLFYLKGKIKNNIESKDKLEIKKLLNGFWPFLIETTSLQIDIWLLSNFVGNAVTGAYAAYKIIEIPIKVIGFGYINIGSTKLKNSESIEFHVKQSSLILFIVGCLLILSIYLFGKPLVTILIGESFSNYISIAYYIIFNGVFSGVSGILMNIIQLKNDNNLYYKIQSVDGIIKIILMIIGCALYGSEGIFISMILNSAIKSILLFKIVTFKK
jgi:O-antigen/teichoic acid export membrane protein